MVGGIRVEAYATLSEAMASTAGVLEPNCLSWLARVRRWLWEVVKLGKAKKVQGEERERKKKKDKGSKIATWKGGEREKRFSLVGDT